MKGKDKPQSKLLLQFQDQALEKQYRSHVVDNTLIFCRVAWLSILLAGGSFGFLDRMVFGEQAGLVLTVRVIVVLVSLLILGLTFIPRVRSVLVASSGLFILLVGLFSVFLTAMDSGNGFSLYFLGIFMGFAGIFTTSGMGFRWSVLAMTLVLISFEVVFIRMVSLESHILIVYSAFLAAMLVLFGYAAWLVERVSRNSFLARQELQTSLEEVEKLSGLLPICSKCKKIRDDSGYWSNVEQYIATHTKVQFSHGLCPDCTHEMFPHLGEKNKY